jgi:hypothetical protein
MVGVSCWLQPCLTPPVFIPGGPPCELRARSLLPPRHDLIGLVHHYVKAVALLLSRTQMRLLETTSLEIVEVSDDAVPTYAILSHTWGRGEVTLQDLREMHGRRKSATVVKSKPGYSKLQRSAALAAEHGFQYIWYGPFADARSFVPSLSLLFPSQRWPDELGDVVDDR